MELWVQILTSVLAFVGGSGFLKVIQVWRSANKEDYAFLSGQQQDMIRELRKVLARTEGTKDKLKDEIVDLKVENIQLRGKLNDCEQQRRGG